MVKILSRDSINRMVGRKSSVAGVGGGGGDVDLSGYATKIWTQETFVSIDFFRSLFRAYDSQNHEILPNDTTSTIDNIKAMFGFWTEQYLSALGQGSGGGGGGASALSDLLDVQLTNPTNGQALIYNSTLCKWVNGSAGTDMASVWENLAGGTTEQINVSHLTNALIGYVTTSDISDMATETWVTNNFLTQTAASSTYLSIAFFNRLFQAYAGTGSSAIRVNPNDTTSTIDNIKAMFGFWTEQYLSALGQGTGGGGGGVGDVTWDLLADNSDTRQIALSHLTTALSGYALTSQLPTKVSQLTNDSGYITSSALDDYARISLVDGRLSMNYDTNGNNVDFNAITYNASTGIVIQPIHIPNYSGCSNYPFNQYGTLVTFSGSTSFPFQLASYQGGALYYRADNYQPTSPFNFNSSTGWVRIIDSSNIGSYLGSYLPLSGGTISGTLTVNSTTNGWGIHGYSVYNNEFSSAFLTYAGYGAWIGVSTNDSNHYILNVRKNISGDGSGGDAVIYARSDGNVGIGTDSPAYPLDVNGYSRDIVTFFKNYNDNGNAGYVGRGSGSANTIMLVAYSGNAVGIGANQLDLYIDTSHNVGIGTTSPSYKLHVAGNIYATGGVTALSDARHKTIINPTKLKVEQIAKMPAVVYRWNDGRDDNSLHVGSIAQDWQRILPEVVMKANDEEGTLSMQYGVAALVSSIITARKVVDHERRIAELERENKELKLKFKIA